MLLRAPDALRYLEAGLDKGSAYLEMEPLFAQGRVALLDHARLTRELKMLERRPRAGGKTLVDHPHGAHDDHANATALAIALALRRRGGMIDVPIGPITITRTAAPGGTQR